MRKILIGFVAGFILLAIVLILFLFYMINGGNFKNNFVATDLKLVKVTEVKLDNIEVIDSKFYADDVEIIKSETEDIVIKEYRTEGHEKDNLAEIETKQNRLLIRGDENRSWFNIGRNWRRVELYLPEQFQGELFVKTSSGGIKSEEVLNLKNFEASASSGSIHLHEVFADNINIATSSGSIAIDTAQGDRKIASSSGTIKLLGGNGATEITSSSGNLYIEQSEGPLTASASSGSIRIQNVQGKKEVSTSSGTIYIEASEGEMILSSTSGSIKISDVSGSGRAETSSGVISMDLKELTDSLSLVASSGSVKLNLPKEATFRFDASVSSGTIRTDFDEKLTFDKNKKNASGSVGENAGKDIKIQTSSGNISVMQD